MNRDTLLWIGAGLLAYFYFSRTAMAAPSTYPTSPTGRPSGSSGGGVSIGGGAIPVGTGSGSTSYSSGGINPQSVDLSQQPLPTSATQYGLTPTVPPVMVGTVVDPCDPNSYYYDATACTNAQGQPPTGSTDSMDPCDPSSSAYDPSSCYAD